MKYVASLLALFMLLPGQASAEGSTPLITDVQVTEEQQQYIDIARKIWQSLNRQTGEISLPNGVATLNVPETFYYLSPEDAKTVLVEAWGNPPESSGNTLGMLFPAGSTPFESNAWGVTIEYTEDGYVADDDADNIDYDEMLQQMQEGTHNESKARVEKGYQSIELIGWAAKPYYDSAEHKLHWAKEVRFGDVTPNTLNYNIRVLGRKGVLILNFIAGMDQKPVIDANIDTVLSLANFNEGQRYNDFNPDIDTVAGYGIGALVAGKVAAKTGLIAALILFLKKFGVYIAIGVVALLGKFFKRKKSQQAEV